MKRNYTFLFLMYLALWFVLNMLLFDNSVVESVLGAVFFALIMTVFNFYSDRRWGVKIRAEVERMKSLKPEDKHGKPKE